MSNVVREKLLWRQASLTERVLLASNRNPGVMAAIIYPTYGPTPVTSSRGSVPLFGTLQSRVLILQRMVGTNNLLQTMTQVGSPALPAVTFQSLRIPINVWADT